MEYIVIEQCGVLPDQSRDEHSQGQAALEDKTESLHTAAASGILWPECTVKSSCIFRGSFRVNDSLKFKHTHKSKPLAVWASQWLDWASQRLAPHHPGAQLHVQTRAVICLTPPHTKFKAAGNSYNSCTHVQVHRRAHHWIFCSSSWQQLFQLTAALPLPTRRHISEAKVCTSWKGPLLPGSWAVLWLCQHAGTRLSLVQPEHQALQIHHAS